MGLFSILLIDGAGNAWVTNNSSNSVTEISSSGAFLSGTNGYSGGGLNGPSEIAIDGAGNAWMTSSLVSSVSELSTPTGRFSSGTTTATRAVAWNAAIGVHRDRRLRQRLDG